MLHAAGWIIVGILTTILAVGVVVFVYLLKHPFIN